MLRLVHVHRPVWSKAWPFLFGLLMVAAWNAASVCGLCPQKSTATHCSGKDAHSASPATKRADVSALATAIQDPAVPCAHCVTHPPAETNSSSQATLPNNGSQVLAAADLYVVSVEFSASHSLVETHEHGPPGDGNPRYLLNSSFRI